MLTRIFAAVLCLLILAGVTFADVFQGKITKITVATKEGEHHFIKVSINGNDRGFVCTNAKFLDEAGKEIKDGIKSKLVKEGADVTITTKEIVLSEGGQRSTHSQTVSVQLKKPKEEKK